MTQTKHPSLDQLMALAVDYAEAGFKQEGQLPPTFFFSIPGKGAGIAPTTGWANEAERIITLEMIRASIAVIEAESYAVISEAWHTKGPATGPRVQPSDSETRREVIFIIAKNRDGQTRGLRIFIERDADGNGVLGRREPIGNGVHSGALFNLFDPPGPSAPAGIEDDIRAAVEAAKEDLAGPPAFPARRLH